uniref:Uncharacterized protein n=1 Tax=Meloidogyne javanica TaxID=6303 RepID=A0A915LT62_MELJA
MFPPPIYPHHQYHSNPDDLVDKQIELIEKTEKKFSQMIEKVDKFKEKYIEINPKLILGNALKKIAEKLPKEAIVYKELFDKLKLFWFDKVEEDLNVENENAERPLISLETPQNEKRNNFAKEWEDDTLKALSDGLQVNQPTEKPTQIISPQYTQHGQRNIDVHGQHGPRKVEDLRLQENLLNLRKTKKTIELEDINKLIKNDYGASDEELTPSRILDYEASKLENNNDFRNIMLKVLWKKNKKEAPTYTF